MRELAAEADRGRGLYRKDPWSWSREQAAAMRRGDIEAIDWDNVIEEIEDVAGRDEAAWVSYCKNVISHLLKIEHSGGARAINHWRKEIEGWRREMHDKLSASPGMKGSLSGLLDRAWRLGRADALQRLAEPAESEDWAAEKRVLRELQRRLPAERHYSLVDIAGYDPFIKKAEPDANVWPAPVARAMNEALGADYPVRPRVQEREGGRSR